MNPTAAGGGLACDGSGVARINNVTLRRAQLVLRWTTVRRYIVLVCNQPLRPTQPPILCGTGNGYRPRECSAAGKVIVGLAVCGRLYGTSIYGLDGPRRGAVHRTYTSLQSIAILYLYISRES